MMDRGKIRSRTFVIYNGSGSRNGWKGIIIYKSNTHLYVYYDKKVVLQKYTIEWAEKYFNRYEMLSATEFDKYLCEHRHQLKHILEIYDPELRAILRRIRYHIQRFKQKNFCEESKVIHEEFPQITCKGEREMKIVYLLSIGEKIIEISEDQAEIMLNEKSENSEYEISRAMKVGREYFEIKEIEVDQKKEIEEDIF